MKYIVSGYRRCGTSMMMKALNNGLSDAHLLYAPDYEDRPNVNGYNPTPGGHFGLAQAHYMDAVFLRDEIPDDSIAKIFFNGLPLLPPYSQQYTIVFMRRNPEEIKLSLQKLKEYWAIADPDREEFNEKLAYHPFDVFRDYNEADMQHVLSICDQRKDFDLHIVQYGEIIKDPLKVFSELRDAGIPLDVARAAAIIDPTLHRQRLRA